MNPTDKNVNPNFSGVTTGGEYATLNSPKPISVTGLNENVKPYVPPPETPTPNYSGIAKTATDVALSPSPTITSPNGTVLDINGNIITPAKTDTTSSSESIQEKTNKILAGMGMSTNQPAQKSFADQYKELTGIDPNTLSRERINNLAKVNELSARLKALDVQALKNQEDAMKRGETLGFASREAQNIARTDAIERLAVSSELNAYQGRLESAQADIRTLLDLTFKDEQLKTERADKAYERAYAIATNEEKKELDKLKTENDAKKEENQNLFTLKQTYIKQALDNGDYKTASEIATATTNEQLQGIVGGMKGSSLDNQYKQIQIENARLQGQKIKQEIESGQPLTGEWASVINGASGLVASTKKQTVKTNIANAIASGNYINAYAEIANAVSDGITGTNKTKFDDARTDLGILSGMRTAIQNYANAGGDMGLLKGTAEDIKRKLGVDSGKASVLATQLWREFQTYRSNMTGAAFTPQESRDYASVNPTLGKSLDLNLNVIDGALAQLENRVVSTVNARVPEAKKIYDLAKGKQNTDSVSQVVEYPKGSGKKYNVDANGNMTPI